MTGCSSNSAACRYKLSILAAYGAMDPISLGPFVPLKDPGPPQPATGAGLVAARESLSVPGTAPSSSPAVVAATVAASLPAMLETAASSSSSSKSGHFAAALPQSSPDWLPATAAKIPVPNIQSTGNTAGGNPAGRVAGVSVPVASPPAGPGGNPASRLDTLLQIARTNSQDVYHGPAEPLSAPLLSQKGVGAYVQLLNAAAGNELHARSADSLTGRLQSASSELKLAYTAAAARLSPRLAVKDWGFSVANGKLILIVNQDPLSDQDMRELHAAFLRPNVEAAAREVADVITTVVQMRKTGADSGSLAWARFDVEVDNFSEVVDLRKYVTASAPGSHYHPNTTTQPAHLPIPPTLGGMDLRELVTARPRFLRADGSVNPDAVPDFETPRFALDAQSLSGQCACGQIQFIVQNEFEYAYYCHCSRCRARTGSVFAAIGGIPIEKLEVIAGHDHLLLEGECSDGYGARCGCCQSFLFSAVRGRQYLHVSLGVVAGTPGRLPDHHVYVGSKAPWYRITDGLPQFEETP